MFPETNSRYNKYYSKKQSKRGGLYSFYNYVGEAENFWLRVIEWLQMAPAQVVETSIGSLSNYDGVVNESGKKPIGLDSWQNNNFARFITLFWYISLSSLHDYDMKMPNFTFCGERDHKTTTLFLFSWTSIQSFKIQPQKKLPTFDELNQME